MGERPPRGGGHRLYCGSMDLVGNGFDAECILPLRRRRSLRRQVPLMRQLSRQSSGLRALW
jgi:hypothetical protein